MLLYAFNFEGAGHSLEARRIEVEHLLGVSESTIKRDELAACKELASVLLALDQSPCAPSPTPGPGEPIDPSLLATLVQGLVDNRLSAQLRTLAAQIDPGHAEAVLQAIRDGGKLTMGLRLIEKLRDRERPSARDLIADLLGFVDRYPDERIARQPVAGLAAADIEWAARYLRTGGFRSTNEAATAAQASVHDRHVSILEPGDERPSIYYAQFVRNTFNLVTFHLIREESHGWPLLKAAVGSARTSQRETQNEHDIGTMDGGAS